MFDTQRLTIRPFTPADAPRLYAIHQQDGVKRWIPNESYADLQEAQDAIRFYTDCVNAGHLPYVLAVEAKATGELIGDVGVNEVEGRPGEVEIGYCICDQASGQGFATELVQAMGRCIVETFGVRTLYGRVMHGNAASARVLEKCGYTFVCEESGAEDDPYGLGMLVYRKTY